MVLSMDQGHERFESENVSDEGSTPSVSIESRYSPWVSALSLWVTMRPCGDCQICCDVFAVPALALAEATRCDHQSPSGCAVYPDRPAACRGFACSWAVGDPALPRAARPDRAGAMVWWEGASVRVIELRPGALERPALREALSLYAIGFHRQVQRFDGARLEAAPGEALRPAAGA